MRELTRGLFNNKIFKIAWSKEEISVLEKYGNRHIQIRNKRDKMRKIIKNFLNNQENSYECTVYGINLVLYKRYNLD